MSSDQFLPANDLEQSLVGAMAGQLPVTQLTATFLRSQVFVLLDADPGPSGVWDNSSHPMVLKNASGYPFLAVFTDPRRSSAWAGDASGFPFGLLVAFHWLVQGIRAGVGIVVNPGLQVGMEIPASDVAALQAQAHGLAQV